MSKYTDKYIMDMGRTVDYYDRKGDPRGFTTRLKITQQEKDDLREDMEVVKGLYMREQISQKSYDLLYFAYRKATAGGGIIQFEERFQKMFYLEWQIMRIKQLPANEWNRSISMSRQLDVESGRKAGCW